MNEWIEQLLAMLEDAEEWPMPSEAPIVERVNKWAAFREADGEELRPRDWGKGDSESRDYLVSPLPARIAGAKSDMVFGEDPEFTAEQEGDQESLDGVVRENTLPARLQFAERICASEGEVWWRAYTDPAFNYPLVQFLSRAFVVPLFRGPLLLAVAFVSELDRPEGALDKTTWRHVEIQAEGQVCNYLFEAGQGTKGLGDMRELDAHPDTADLQEVWDHGLPVMVCGRVMNDEDQDPEIGVSDYQPVEDMLYALNEAHTIGVENARLTAKQKVIVPQRFLDEHGRFPGGAEVMVATEIDQDPDKPGQGFAQIEFEFDATALIAWLNYLTDATLAGTRTSPALVGRHTEGAQTGPALRARLLDSVLDAHGKGRYWDDELPRILLALQLLDALAPEQGGLGNQWTAPDVAPTVERQSILPEDEQEQSQRIATEVGSLLLSRRSAIAERHPDWDEDKVDEEMAQIEKENPLPEIPA